MKTTNKKRVITVALIDDHQLFRNALASLIEGFGNCRVVHQAGNGKELINYIHSKQVPDVVLLDLNMPEMNGYETAEWLQKHQPTIHVLMLTMYDSELTLIKLLQAGVKGFLKKDIHPDELKYAIESVMQSGFYYTSHATGKLMNLFRGGVESNLERAMLGPQELRFLELACTDLTYKEIAVKMNLNPRNIDTLRDQLFIKFDVKSRVGLAMLAIKNGLVAI